MDTVTTFCTDAQQVIDIELNELTRLRARLNHHFDASCELMLNCRGRVIVTGMGKSGHIGKKIAATLASTGTPAFFVHPAEACHGDLGMLTKQDLVLAISYSGETDELLNLLPLIKLFRLPLIVMTGNLRSRLAQNATHALDIHVTQEACPLGLAPTSSTTLALVLGDALAISLLKARGFSSTDFARFHPSGALGRRLLMSVADIMHRDAEVPRVTQTCTVANALLEITSKRLGMTTVVDEQQHLVGIFTDGDLRRLFEKGYDIHQTLIETVMTKNYSFITPSMLAAEALGMMRTKQITALPVVNEQRMPVGIIHMHDLLRAGVV